MKRTIVYEWEEKDIRGGMMVYPKRGNPMLVGYIITRRGKNEQVLIDQRDGMVLRSQKWNTKKRMAAYLTAEGHSPLSKEEEQANEERREDGE